MHNQSLTIILTDREGDGPDNIPWSNVWNTIVSLCRGFKTDDGSGLEDVSTISDFEQTPLHSSSFDDEIDASDAESSMGRIRLPCHPATVIYGHAATRDLDLKRWSKGLDSGCVSNWFLLRLPPREDPTFHKFCYR